MVAVRYLDFDLLIERRPAGYRVRVLDSPAGQASGDFVSPLTAAQLDAVFADLSQAGPGRAFGEQLFAAVFQGEVLASLRRSQESAARQDRGLRIRLRLTDVPELAAWPWECLFDPVPGQFLALSAQTPLVRYLDLPQPAPPLAVRPPLRVLALIASPPGWPPLDVQREWNGLTAALSGLIERGLVRLERLEHASFAELQRRLRGEEWHVIHFLGHGGFDPASGEGVLLLEDGGSGRAIDGGALGTLLSGYRSLRLTVLNSCEGARASQVDSFSGVAQSLVRQGIPAVIAMQTQVVDTAASAFARGFYEAVADGYAVDAALAEARQALHAQSAGIEWAVPVLYMRSPDGCIFDVVRLDDVDQRRNQVAALLNAARAAIAAEEWQPAIAGLQTALTLEPADAAAAALLREARQGHDLAELFASGRTHYDAGRWREALDYFRQVQALGGNYRGVFGFIATVQHQIQDSAAPPAAPAVFSVGARPPDPLDGHYRMVAKAFAEGRVIPFLGAGVNLCGRPAGVPWRQGQYLPAGGELAAYLAEAFGYPPDEALDLVRVSQYVAVMNGSGPLYEGLHALLDADYPPTPLHQLLASLPGVLRGLGYPPRYQLIVTTNYDDVLERTFRAAGEPFDLVTYIAEGEERGKFLHVSPAGEPVLIDRPNEYRGLNLDQRPVILKIHGAVDRANPERDSYIITEDHYIDYLTRTDISNLIPVMLAAKLRKSHFLFLGYSLRDWNLRVILHRIWGEQKLNYKSWAIQLKPQTLDQEFWRKRDVDILDVRLEDYVAALSQRFTALPRWGSGP